MMGLVEARTTAVWRPEVRSWVSSTLAAILIALIVVVMTQPQSQRMGTAVADADDSYFSMWRLAWVAHQLARDPVHLFDGNIFYPQKGTLALSDAMLLPGLVAAPAIWLGIPLPIVYNVLLLAGFAASGFAMFLLARQATGHFGAAIVAAVIFALAPYRIAHFAHLELQWAMWMPLALWSFNRAIVSGKRRDGIVTGLFVALQGLSSLYYVALFACYALVVGGVLLWQAGAPALRRVFGGAAIGLVLAAAILAPYVLPYRQSREEHGPRVREEVRVHSAEWIDYVKVHPWNRLYGRWTWWQAPEAVEELSLFPGFCAAALAVLGAWPALRGQALAHLLGLIVAVDLSLGIHGLIFPWLRAYVVPFESLRAPSRAAILVLLSLSLLAAIGLAKLVARMPLWRATIMTVAIVLVCMAEYWSAPVYLRDVPRRVPSVYAWLRTQRPDTVVIELPIPRPTQLWMKEPLYEYMSVFHWKHLVNGYSGFVPIEYARTLTIMQSFPDDRSVNRLRELGVDYVIIHPRDIEPEKYLAMERALTKRREFDEPIEFGDQPYDAVVYRMLPAEGK